jgi:hypothetical protein
MGLPLAALVVGGIGAAVSAGGMVEQGRAQANAADYQAQVARNNALIAQQNATWTAQSGEAKVAAEGMKTAQRVGSAKAAQGASNIDVNTGSAANVRQAMGKVGATDALTIRSNTAREAYGYEVSGVSDIAQSQLLTSEAQQAPIGADIGGVGTFLSGASSVGGRYAAMQLGQPAAATIGGA